MADVDGSNARRVIAKNQMAGMRKVLLIGPRMEKNWLWQRLMLMGAGLFISLIKTGKIRSLYGWNQRQSNSWHP